MMRKDQCLEEPELSLSPIGGSSLLMVEQESLLDESIDWEGGALVLRLLMVLVPEMCFSE